MPASILQRMNIIDESNIMEALEQLCKSVPHRNIAIFQKGASSSKYHCLVDFSFKTDHQAFFRASSGFTEYTEVITRISANSRTVFEVVPLNEAHTAVVVGAAKESPNKQKYIYAKITNLLISKEQYRLKNEQKLVGSALDTMIAGSDVDPYTLILRFIMKTYSASYGTVWQLHDNTSLNDTSFATLEQALHAGSDESYFHEYEFPCLQEGNGYLWGALSEESNGILAIVEPKETSFVNTTVHKHYDGKTVLILRLQHNDHVHGVVVLAVKNELIFDHSDYAVRSLPKITELTRIHGRHRARERLLHSIVRLSPSSDEDPEEYIQKVTQTLLDLLDVDVVAFYMQTKHSKNHLKLVSLACSKSKLLSKQYHLSYGERRETEFEIQGDPYFEYVIQREEPIIVNMLEGAEHEIKNSKFDMYEIESEFVNSAFAMPVFLPDGGGNSISGVLRCLNKKTRSLGHVRDYVFGEADYHTCREFCSLVASHVFAVQARAQLKRTNDRLLRLDKVRKHETASPLASIRANARMLSKDIGVSSSKKTKGTLREIEDDANICSLVIEENSMLVNRDYEERHEIVSVRDLLDDLANFLRRQAYRRSEPKITRDKYTNDLVFTDQIEFLTVEVLGSCQRIPLKKAMIQRAFYNLGTNAMKYSKPGGRLKISISEKSNPDVAVIVFEDNGIGVPKDEVKKIFRSNYRATNAREICQGEGIGLAMVMSIVSHHSGKLYLDTTVERKSRFVIELPVVPIENHELIPASDGIIRVDKNGIEF